MGSASFVPTFFKPLEAEGGGMLMVMLEGAQLLYFSCFPSSAQPYHRRGPWNS